jgi:hypothetical protein
VPLLEVTRLASITFWSLAFFWIDKPWFLTEGKFDAILIIPSSWGSQLDGDLNQHLRKQQRYRIAPSNVSNGDDTYGSAAISEEIG